MRKLCVGIDVAKDKFDVMYTIDGENYFGYATIPNNKKGIKNVRESFTIKREARE